MTGFLADTSCSEAVFRRSAVDLRAPPEHLKPPPQALQEFGPRRPVPVVQLVRIFPQIVELSLAGSVLDVEVLFGPYGLESGPTLIFLRPHPRPRGLPPAFRQRVAGQQRLDRTIVGGG